MHSLAPSSRWRVALAVTLVQLAISMLGAVAIPARAAAAGFEIAPGRYDITAQVVMPHMDEMRRKLTSEQRCLGADNPVALFPVMRQPALRGCALDYPVAEADTWQYILVCESARVATGTARFNRSRDRIIGMLDVKMGGKNMTFSQRIEAVLHGDCTASE